MSDIKIGDTVVMPEPMSDGDYWTYGGFAANVEDILDSGNLIVIDADGDFWEVEPSRVTKEEHE